MQYKTNLFFFFHTQDDVYLYVNNIIRAYELTINKAMGTLLCQYYKSILSLHNVWISSIPVSDNLLQKIMHECMVQFLLLWENDFIPCFLFSFPFSPIHCPLKNYLPTWTLLPYRNLFLRWSLPPLCNSWIPCAIIKL